MSQVRDGGPAFPHRETTSRGEPFHDHLGLTKRELFAMAAMQGYIAVPDDRTFRRVRDGETPEEYEAAAQKWREVIRKYDAEHCVAMADALLAALNPHPEATLPEHKETL